ncbi:LAME_0B05776g1_1 [Lachancea meyersii CBS 8951]|uniref:LAME_0B05776g1_1 n=1 Tax=Lachancea meyersii CBS 8951 TaxID=1266667 RepID=A0A1G4IVL8_9SACH|nr:LAME_0B05776g1_1 [Lachancea meyersii CBS 8951]
MENYHSVGFNIKYILTSNSRSKQSPSQEAPMKRLEFWSRVLPRCRYYNKPPTYFGGSAPRPVLSVPAVTMREPARKPLLGLATVISVLALSLLALDSYRVRLSLEAKLEQEAEQFKQTQDLITREFKANRKKRELQVLNERRRVQMREMKVALHVALLRKQLVDAGITPATIQRALEEFDKNAKMENSIENVSGTRLWVTENSDCKSYVSDIREYD